MIVVASLWTAQAVVFALMDTRRGGINLLANIIALALSTYLTYKWGGLAWVVVPLLVMPILGGVAGGLTQGRKDELSD